MKRLLTSTTALAVALTSGPVTPIWAQSLDDAGRVIGADGAVLCTPAEGAPCDLEAIIADLARQAAAAAAAAEAARQAEEAAAAAAAEAARQAEEAAAAAAAEAARQAEEAAAAAAAEAARQAEEAAAAAAAEAARQAEEAAAAAAARAAEEAAAAAARAAEEAAAAAAAAATAGSGTPPEPAAAATPEVAATPETTPAPAPEVAPEIDTAAEPAPVIPPVPEAEAVTALESILAAPDPAATEAPAAPAAAAVAETAAPGAPAVPAPAPAETTVTTITAADTRSSAQEFQATPTADAGGRRKLSDLERVGLLALGALAVGAILNNGDEVVSNTGDRVVVRRDDGSYQVLKDDDTILRRPGSTLRTETFRDGSTRTTVERDDGTRVVTIRDASGRVLRRASIDAFGRETLLIDDLSPVQPIDVTRLPRPVAPVTISASNADPELAGALARIAAREAGRSFSLRQIREIPEVRRLAPQIDVTPITFATGSSAIAASEAGKLAELGRFIATTIRARPYELFLIEGHTDAVGSDASNLTLSDRRAESLALALTEYFGVPPENLVVQGYGESDLLIPTQAAEPRNRRVAVRMISPLLMAAR